MNDEKPDFADALRRMAAADRPPVDMLPTPEELIAYCQDELSEPRMETLRELFARSPEATRLLLDCLAFLDLGDEPESASSHADPEAKPAEGAPTRAQGPPPRPGIAVGPRWRLLVAALAGAVVPVAAWMALRTGDPPTHGRANVVIAALQPATEGLRSGFDEDAASLPADAVVVLHVPEPVSERAVRLVLRDAEQRTVWEIGDLVADSVAANSFVVELPAALLAPGRYEIALFGEGKEALARYRFAVDSP